MENVDHKNAATGKMEAEFPDRASDLQKQLHLMLPFSGSLPG